ncbi:hypothetical protein [Candidatus Manganitrophus noduliformans]|uniref:Uncharacterized protein n=1 Tax=Candidatus Manganitrophus noduliformans TaxID=2606439 RepID=A0A7X6DQ16_9BACT|nr:hypothetical protein [Candidatus Manganitrophus noduliformans]NKE71255.1 hypothetical protein [Candidatus Manganitrophus noduliformans]
MELEVYRGEFVNKADAIRELVDREREIKTAFLSLPKDSSSELIGKGAQEIEAILTKKTFEICRQLARGYKGLKIRQGEAPTNAPENKP